jgi:hypothetical protein
MAKKRSAPTPQFMRWSDHVPASEVQDPLGLGLRGSTRLASLLLYCITSITPRARYFSFIPWCIFDFRKNEQGQPHALGLKEAIRLREIALTYGCVAHHDGEPCEGGALVGSTAATKWLATHDSSVPLKKVPFAKNPALDAYINSLVNLGCFLSEEERAESESELEDSEFTFDDLELSNLGQDLAKTYESIVGRLGAVKHLSELDRTCSISSLKEFGKWGGLCELADPSSPDRNLLRDVFFARKGFTKKSHFRRNRSLTLILELCRQLSSRHLPLKPLSFSSSVYYGQLVDDDGNVVKVSIPQPLVDIATRWRMFYFHHFMSVALEGVFSWLVTQLNGRGLSGATISEFVEDLKSPLVSRSLGEQFDFDVLPEFGSTSPSEFFRKLGITSSTLDEAASQQIDSTITAQHACAEHHLEVTIRNRQYLQSPTGLAVPAILFALSLGRYHQWESTEYGNWLTSDAVVKDQYLDLLPSTASLGLERHLGDWWNQPWTRLVEYLLSRFVVQQHQSMSYERTASGDRCLLQVDGQRIVSDSSYERIGLGNPRFASAMQVLVDLALIEADENDVSLVTKEGLQLLKSELERGEA